MGTTLITFLLSLFLLLFFFSCVAAAQSVVPSSVTAKAAAIQYWNLKFPNSKPLPPFFLSKLSTLSPPQIAANFHTDHPDAAPSEGRGPPNNIRMVTSDADSSENYSFRYQTDHTSGSTSSNFDDSGALRSGYAHSSNKYFIRYDAGTDSLSTYSNFDDNGASASYQTETGNFDDNGDTARYQTETGSSTSSNFDDNGDTASYQTETGSSSSSKFDDSGATTSGNVDSSSHDNKSTLVNRNRNSHRHNVPLGILFRESDLKKGTAMRVQFGKVGKMLLDPHFLPRSIASEIPFSANAVKEIFHVSSETATGKAVDASIALCEKPPNQGETKRCISSAEDMMDFVLESLGSDNVQVRSTTNFNGAGRDILIGDVKAVNDGKFTETLSCHQLTFPYLLHHCHVVPKTRLYEVDMLEIGTKKKINHAAAICHVDTSSWGAGHAAFLVLGSAPGKIEVCHWIFPQGMVWTAAATQ